MKIVVCVKQIPDPASPYQLDPENHFVVRPDDQVLDDTDRYGVEVALQLADAVGDEGSVTLLSMSPGGSQQGIRQALAMGADGAILVEDPTLRGADALTTSRILAAAASRAESRPRNHRHRVDRRLHRSRTPADGRTHGRAFPDLRSQGGARRRQDPHRASNPGWLRRRRRGSARGAVSDVRCSRAALPHLQGDHAGQVEARRNSDRRRPRSVPVESVSRSSRSNRCRRAKPAKSSRTTAKAISRSSPSSKK